MLAGGVPIEVLQMMLGHSTPAVTRRVYAHVMRRVAAEQLETATDLVTRHRRGRSADKLAWESAARREGLIMK